MKKVVVSVVTQESEASKAIKTKHKTKVISAMSQKDLAEIVQLLAIQAGIADKDGKVK